MASTWRRRRLIKVVFFGTLGAAAVGGAAGLLGFLYPRKTDEGVVQIASRDVPRAGEPPLTNRADGFHLVNLMPDEGLLPESAGVAPGGLLALSSKCTHLGCMADWNNNLSMPERTLAVGAFDCPCHDSFFTKAGLRISGPAPRSLDTLAVEVTNLGALLVHTSRKQLGSADNASRAVPWTPPR